MSSNADVNTTAARGFGSAAGEYERSRPDYPADAVGHLVSTLGIGPGRVVLDLACGTGKMTRMLTPTGTTVVGVDPVGSMLAQFQAALDSTPVACGVAEALPLADRCLDAVVVAQGFHWFRGPDALAEIARTLKPHGALGLIWNVRDESVPWVAKMGDIFRDYENRTAADVLRFWKGKWRAAFEDAASPFEPLERRDFRHEQWLTTEGAVERVLSVSFIAILPDEERAQVAERIRQIVATDPDTRDRERFPLPYRVETYVARPRPRA